MKKWLYSLWGASGLIMSLLYAAPTPAAITVSVQPPSTTIAPGNAFSVAIRISGLTTVDPDEIVRAYDLLLGYDTTLLTATGVTYGSFLNGGQVGGSSQSSDLTFNLTTVPYSGPYSTAVDFSELSNLCGYAGETVCAGTSFAGGPYLSNIQSDTFNLVSIAFQAKSAFQSGSTILGLIDDSSMNLDQGFDVKGISTTTPLTISLANGVVTIPTITVPEPGTLSLLLGVGLLGVGRSAIRRWQNTVRLS